MLAVATRERKRQRVVGTGDTFHQLEKYIGFTQYQKVDNKMTAWLDDGHMQNGIAADHMITGNGDKSIALFPANHHD